LEEEGRIISTKIISVEETDPSHSKSTSAKTWEENWREAQKEGKCNRPRGSSFLELAWRGRGSKMSFGRVLARNTQKKKCWKFLDVKEYAKRRITGRSGVWIIAEKKNSPDSSVCGGIMDS